MKKETIEIIKENENLKEAIKDISMTLRDAKKGISREMFKRPDIRGGYDSILQDIRNNVDVIHKYWGSGTKDIVGDGKQKREGNWFYSLKNRCNVQYQGEDHLYDRYEEVIPIEVTPEILKNSDFFVSLLHSTNNRAIYKKGEFILEVDNGYKEMKFPCEGSFECINYIGKLYVHQLQNGYFDLTGKELDIKL